MVDYVIFGNFLRDQKFAHNLAYCELNLLITLPCTRSISAVACWGVNMALSIEKMCSACAEDGLNATPLPTRRGRHFQSGMSRCDICALVRPSDKN